jgi:hypothetical protein
MPSDIQRDRSDVAGSSNSSGGIASLHPVFSDNFATNQIASAYSPQYLPGGVAPVVGSGVATMPSAGSVYSVNAFSGLAGDVKLQAKANPGTQAGIVGLAARLFDGSNFMMGAWTGAGSLAIYLCTVAGGLTTVSTTAFAPTASTNYWLVFVAHGNYFRVEAWAAVPTPLTSTPAASTEITFTGTNALRFGSGTIGGAGIVALNGNGTQTFDDLSITAL